MSAGVSDGVGSDERVVVNTSARTVIRAVLITGSNMGGREGNLLAAREMLGRETGTVVAASRVYESEPWGEMGDGGGAFLNQALVVETTLDPIGLLDATQEIERRIGRTSKGVSGGHRVYASRVIDIDIIYFGDVVMDTERLTLPHPLIADREFVLLPLAEVLEDMRHPVTGKTAGEMLSELRNK